MNSDYSRNSGTSQIKRLIENRFAWRHLGKMPAKAPSSRKNNLDIRLESGGFKPMKIGLSGFNSPTGLGYQNRDLVKHLSLSKWLCIQHAYLDTLPDMPGIETTHTSLQATDEDIDKWLDGLDCVLFYEQPQIEHLVSRAVAKNIAVVCIPNWEWLSPNASWLHDVDLFICPNEHTLNLLQKWKSASNAIWNIAYVPAPIDTDRFSYNPRAHCESFLFINGNGGCTPYFKGILKDKRGPLRKGLKTVIEAAKMVPDIPIYIRSQVKQLPSDLPSNIQMLPDEEDNSNIYNVGDVAIQPSLFEGTGLQLLETLSTGLPLISTDAPPMNEMPNIRRLPAESLYGRIANNIITVNLPSHEALARAMREVYNTDISVESSAAREFIEKQHSWPAARETMHKLLGVTQMSYQH